MMSRRTAAAMGLVLCLTGIVPPSHSQSQQSHEARTQEILEGMRRQQEQWREQNDRQMARFREQAKRDSRRSLDEAQRQAIGATPSQWQTIGPRLQVVQTLQLEAYACLRPQVRLHTSESVAQCQWTWDNIFALDPDKPLTAAETTCRVLRDMLADEEIKQARQALRQVVTRRQEAMLVLMGYLD